MDGNGRWAQARGLHRLAGHQEGAKSVRTVVRTSRELGIEALTLYAFSSQNWGRPGPEVEGLMQLLHDYILGERDEIMNNDIRLHATGELHRLPSLVRTSLETLMEASAQNTGMILNLALSYGGRESIVLAAQTLAQQVLAGTCTPKDIDVERFHAAMPTSALPPLDFLIRTSGEQRISNFLLWEAAYAELYFTDLLWPDFGKEELILALQAYAERERRFGLTQAQ